MGPMLIPNLDPRDVHLVGAPVAAAAALPTEHLDVVLIDFPDLPANETRQAVASAMQAIPTFYQASSFGKTIVDMHVSSVWYRSTQRFVDLRCNHIGAVEEAMARAAGEFDFTKANTVMTVIPNFQDQPPFISHFSCPSCTGTRLGLECKSDADCPGGKCNGVGLGGGFIGPVNGVISPSGPVNVGVASVTDGIVTKEAAFRPRTQIHEFTHTLGVPHADTVTCPKRSYEPDAIGAGCSNGIDAFDVMGCCRADDFNPVTKEMLGWLDAQSEGTITASGQYGLGVYDRPGLRVLRAPTTNGRNIYMTYRQSEGIDAPYLPPSVLNGALMYVNRPVFPSNGDWSYMLAAVPDAKQVTDFAFRLNATLRDPSTGLGFTTTSRDANGLQLTVGPVPDFTCTVSDTTALTGQPVTFTAVNATSPIGWSAAGGIPGSGSGPTFSAMYSQPGTYNVTYSFSYLGRVLAATCPPVEVTQPPPPEFSCKESAAEIAKNQNVTFKAIGATPPVTWSAPGASPNAGTGLKFTTQYADAGTYTVTYTFSFSGQNFSTACTVTVLEPPFVTMNIENTHQITIAGKSPPSTAQIDWFSNGANFCRLDALGQDFGPPSFFGTPVALQGSFPFVVDQPWDFRLTCGNAPASLAYDYVTVNTTTAVTDPTPDGNNAQCLFMSSPTSPFADTGRKVGDTIHVTVTMKNTGTKPWSADATPHHLLLVNSGDATWSVADVGLPKIVEPGTAIALRFDTQLLSMAPFATTEPFVWQMAEDGVPFGQACVSRTVMVSTTPAPVPAPDCSSDMVVWGFNGDFANDGLGGGAEDLTPVNGPTFDTVNTGEGSAALNLAAMPSLRDAQYCQCAVGTCTLTNPSAPFSFGCRVRTTGSFGTQGTATPLVQNVMGAFGSNGEGYEIGVGAWPDFGVFGGAGTYSSGSGSDSAGKLKSGKFASVAMRLTDIGEATVSINGHNGSVGRPSHYVPLSDGDTFSIGTLVSDGVAGGGGNRWIGQLDECWIHPSAALSDMQQAWITRCGVKGEFCACSTTEPASYFPCASNADCGGTAVCTQGTCSGLDWGTCLDGAHVNDACMVSTHSSDCGVGHQCDLAPLPPCNMGGCFLRIVAGPPVTER